MCRIVINICLVLLFSVSNVAGQLQNYDSFRQQKGLVSKLGILTVHQHKNRVYLELTESLFGRDFVYVAQVNKGAEMVARPLPSVGVFQFRLGENDKIYFNCSITTLSPIFTSILVLWVCSIQLSYEIT